MLMRVNESNERARTTTTTTTRLWRMIRHRVHGRKKHCPIDALHDRARENSTNVFSRPRSVSKATTTNRSPTLFRMAILLLYFLFVVPFFDFHRKYRQQYENYFCFFSNKKRGRTCTVDRPLQRVRFVLDDFPDAMEQILFHVIRYGGYDCDTS